jgi:hypothetical protein
MSRKRQPFDSESPNSKSRTRPTQANIIKR